MHAKELQGRVSGTVIAKGSPEYEDLRLDLVWNGYKPARYPELIVRVANEDDVVEAVRFAREQNLQVSIRGGGHNWVGFSQRDGSLLIDLQALDQSSIDATSMTAEIEPYSRSQEFNRELAAQGLAFPVGHCATVPMSGFLINGGLGWNSNGWRPACFSVEGARVVTADGEVVVTNERENPDLLWALRGSGPGFFGVVTKYYLKLHPEPKAITSNFYFYPMSSADRLGEWFEEAVEQLPKDVEVLIFMVPAPPDIADRAGSGNGYVCLLSATAFVDSLEEARSAMAVLDESPVLDECLKIERDQATPIDALLDLSPTLWPERLRYLSDTVWSDESPAEVVRITRDHFLRAPSSGLGTIWFSTGEEGVASAHPDAAFSMTGRTLTLCYAIWETPEDDEANEVWHRAMMDDLDRLGKGHYVGESDIVHFPIRHERSFKPENWQRLQELRRAYDPDGLFNGPFTND